MKLKTSVVYQLSSVTIQYIILHPSILIQGRLNFDLTKVMSNIVINILCKVTKAVMFTHLYRK